MNGRTILALATALSGCWWQAPPEPARATDEELHAACYPDDPLTTIDTQACWDLGRRRSEEGPVTEDVIKLYRGGCAGNPEACIELGLLYLEGEGLPRDSDEANKSFGRGCVKSGDACAWSGLVDMQDRPANNRLTEEPQFHSGCSKKNTGWPCTNYGVALACGYFGAPDVPFARHVLDRGCTLGDGRACTVSNRLQVDPEDRPECGLIGPDPDHPVDLELDLTPGPPDLLPDPEHVRRWRAPMRSPVP